MGATHDAGVARILPTIPFAGQLFGTVRIRPNQDTPDTCLTLVEASHGPPSSA